MALSISQTAYLASILKPGMLIASMGYPDLIAPIEDLPGLKYREDSEAICKRHGLEQRKIPDAHSYFSLKDCELDVYDIVAERDNEIILDLNYPNVSNVSSETYDIVLDVGTAEHCFNIGQALMNMAAMVKGGGYIIHENPFNCGNHGFYNLNPTLFHDFYVQNGFDIKECMLVSRDGRQAIVPQTGRFKFTAEELNTFCVARRIEIIQFVFPVQSKYAHLIPAAGASGERDADDSGERRITHG